MKAPARPRGLMDPAFRYRTAAETDIRKTFARVRRELKRAEAEAAQAGDGAPVATVVALPARKGGQP